MCKLVFRNALAGIGISILFATLPAGASALAREAAPESAARQATADQSQEFSSRRKVQRTVAHPQRYRYVRSYRRGGHAYRYRHAHRHAHVHRYGYAARRYGPASRGGSVSLAGIVAPLAAKAQQIVASCGSRVVSAVRHGGHSNHSTGRAVDLQGNPSCIYAMLRGWPGGVSTDYASAPGGQHVHVSYSPGGMEWGLRFAHRGNRSLSASARGAYAMAYNQRPATRWRNARRMPAMMPTMTPAFPNF